MDTLVTSDVTYVCTSDMTHVYKIPVSKLFVTYRGFTVRHTTRTRYNTNLKETETEIMKKVTRDCTLSINGPP